MKFPYRIRRSPAGKKAFVHTSSQVQYYALAFATFWIGIPEKFHAAIQQKLGWSPETFLISVVIAMAVLTLVGKGTSIQRVDTREPEQLQEDPDHEDGAP